MKHPSRLGSAACLPAVLLSANCGEDAMGIKQFQATGEVPESPNPIRRIRDQVRELANAEWYSEGPNLLGLPTVRLTSKRVDDSIQYQEPSVWRPGRPADNQEILMLSTRGFGSHRADGRQRLFIINAKTGAIRPVRSNVPWRRAADISFLQGWLNENEVYFGGINGIVAVDADTGEERTIKVPSEDRARISFIEHNRCRNHRGCSGHRNIIRRRRDSDRNYFKGDMHG